MLFNSIKTTKGKSFKWFTLLFSGATLFLASCSNTSTPPTAMVTPTAQAQVQTEKVLDQGPHLFEYKVVSIGDLNRGPEFGFFYSFPHTGDTVQLLGENFDKKTVIVVDDEIIIKPKFATDSSMVFIFPSNKYISGPNLSTVRVREESSDTFGPHSSLTIWTIYK